MCGIFGIYYFDNSRPVNERVVKDATDVMSHRGPDDSGYYVSGNIGLGHRRLSIIDLSAGHQPMANEDSRVITAYNGEIYNFKEIRQELITKGHTFLTHCDTEVIVHGYEEWGTECVQKFNGMFGFILWDDRSKKVWVVRDRLGIKPLYYYCNEDVFICASEIKPILKTGVIKPELNPDVLDAYFSIGYVPGPETLFKGIKKVLPGHYLLLENGRLYEKRYWDFDSINCKDTSFEHASQQIEALLHDAVDKRLMSDVPIGVFLSGGLDSSAVVGLMRDTVGSDPINTFTVSYRNNFSEEKYARIIADRFDTEHHVFYLEAEDFFSSLRTLVSFAEEPIVEPAAIALYHISKLAREKAIVLLSGEGSDEIFAGYYLYQHMKKIDLFHRHLPGPVKRMINSISTYLPKDKHRKFADWLTSPLEEHYQGTSSYLTPSLKKNVYTPDFYRARSTYLDDHFSTYFNRVRHKDPLGQMLYVDTKTWLVDDLLLKADKMTMAASIELRVPFLDYRLVEAAAALPSEYKINKGEGKYIFKKIVEPFLPDEIVYRKKMGFPVPTESWFQGDLMSEVENVFSRFKNNRFINYHTLSNCLDRHRKGIEDHSKFIMTMLVFAEWLKQYNQ